MELRAVAGGAVALALLASTALALRVGRPALHEKLRSRGAAHAAAAVDDAGCFEDDAGVQTAADEVSAQAIRRARLADPTIRKAAQQGVSFRRQEVEYEACGDHFRGFVVCPSGHAALPHRLPGVLLAPTAVGVHDDFVAFTAERMAALGCVVLVADLFGSATARRAWQDARALMAHNRQDRVGRQTAITLAALKALAAMQEVEPQCLGAVGYCYGGQCVLDLARVHGHVGCGMALRGVVSVHGSLDGGGLAGALAPAGTLPPCLVLHGAEDPFVPEDKVAAFLAEMRVLEADVEFTAYTRTVHGFTRPDKTPGDANMGYSAKADHRAWHSIARFLQDECGVVGLAESS